MKPPVRNTADRYFILFIAPPPSTPVVPLEKSITHDGSLWERVEARGPFLGPAPHFYSTE